MTASPEVAVAVRVTGPALSGVSGGCGNVITFVFDVTLNMSVTGGAATKLALPAWFAVIEHWPTETNVTDEPETVQTAVVLLV